MANPIDSVPSEGHPFTRPAEPHGNKPSDPHFQPCVACGHYHGGINSRINCMTAKIRELQAKIRELEDASK